MTMYTYDTYVCVSVSMLLTCPCICHARLRVTCVFQKLVFVSCTDCLCIVSYANWLSAFSYSSVSLYTYVCVYMCSMYMYMSCVSAIAMHFATVIDMLLCHYCLFLYKFIVPQHYDLVVCCCFALCVVI